jgi:predicted O-methyltransferase YrrM
MLYLPIVPQEQLPLQPIDWRGLTTRFLNGGELEVIIALMRMPTDPVSGVVNGTQFAVEIGCHDGRTAKCALRELPMIVKYVGIEVLPGYEPKLKAQSGELPVVAAAHVFEDERFELIQRPRGSLDVVRADLPPVVDFVFIDGDHSYEAVQHDTKLATAAVRPGGIICWHDYKDEGETEVPLVLHDLSAEGRQLRAINGTWLVYEIR